MLQNVELRYGSAVQSIRVPSRNIVCIAESREAPIVADVRSKIAKALNHPIGLSSMEEVVSQDQKIAIIVDDGTRPTPTHKILPLLLKRLNAIGVNNENLTLVMATGAHERPSQEIIRNKIGGEIINSLNIEIHDCLDKNSLALTGFSTFGTPIWINKSVAEADVKIGVGGIKPHPWAGFSGGAKIVLPGVSSWEAIGRNHMLAVSNDARLGQIEENPVRKDMEEAAGKVGLNMIINTVLNDKGEMIDVVAGDFIDAHRRGVKVGRELFEYTIKDKVDILVAAFGPRDETVWEVLATKFVGAFKEILKDGGTLVLAAACSKGVYQYGWGHLDYSGKVADYSEVIEMLKSGTSAEEMFSETIRGNTPYLEVGIKACLLANLGKTKDVIVASPNLTKDEVSWIGRTSNTPQEALNEALETHGRDATIAIMPSFRSSNAYIRKV